MSDIRNFETSQSLQGDEYKMAQILLDSRPHKSALNGINHQVWIYVILSLLAATELTAAAFFYTSSLGLSFYPALIACAVICFGYHFLLHNIQTEMAEDWSFKKHLSSKAMLGKMVISTILSVVLLLGAASFVNLVGKPSYISYHELGYKPTLRNVAPPAITADMLTSKSGKISIAKIEELTNYTQAQANAENDAVNNEKQLHMEYTKTAIDRSEIIGSTAYILEAILLLLAFGIAKSKYAAVIHKIKAQKEAETQIKLNGNLPNISQTDLLNSAKYTNYAPTLSETSGKPNIGFKLGNGTDSSAYETRTQTLNDTRIETHAVTNLNAPTAIAEPQIVVEKILVKGDAKCEYCNEVFFKNHKVHRFCSDDCRKADWQTKNGRKVFNKKAGK